MDVDLIKNEYFNALYNQQNGYNISMREFKAKHKEEYAIINAMYHKRVKVKKDLDAMIELSNNKVYFGTLTFDEQNDLKSEATKRKQVWRHLNEIFSMVLMVEEHGTENGRYHIHFCGVFKDGLTFDDFFKWSSGREQIEKVKSKRKVARYLCDYVVKQVPRIRRNKTLIECSKRFQKSRSWSNYGFSSLAKDEKANAFTVLFLADIE